MAGEGAPRVFTRAEVAEHKGPPVFVDGKVQPGTEPWFIIHNKVYDVTPWLPLHPGGDTILLVFAGQDVTDDYEKIGHPLPAVEKREEFYIGDIVESEHEEWIPTEEPLYIPPAALKAAGVLAAVALAMYAKKASTLKALPPGTYTRAVRHMHMLMGISIIGTIGFVQKAAATQGNEKKFWMSLHKGSGVALFFALIARMMLRMQSAIPPRFPAPAMAQLVETLSHKAVYVMLLLQALSGMIFHYTYFNQKSKSDEELAENARSFHKKLGGLLEYIWIPTHLGYSAFHAVNGRTQAVVRRMNPML